MRGSSSKRLAWLLALASCSLALEAQAIVGHVPRYYAVINQPKLIPQNGVLAIGLESSSGDVVSTFARELRGIRPIDGGSEPTGSYSEAILYLGARIQDIGWWTPDSPLSIGFYEVVEFEPELNVERLDTFEVVPALEDFELRSLDVASVELDALDVATMQVQCGFSVGTEPPPMITLEYGIVPRITAVLSTDAAPEVVSQHLFALHDPDSGNKASYAPVDLTGDGSEFVVTFSEARDSYCVVPSHFSFFTQAALDLDVVCVDDDGTDWSYRVSASDEQIDQNLELCDDPPPEFLERWCELHADEEWTWEQCDAAANPGTMPSPAPDPTPVEEPDPAPSSDEEPDPAPSSDEEPDPAPSSDEEPDAAPSSDEEPDPTANSEGLDSSAGAESGSESQPTEAEPDPPFVPTDGARSADAGDDTAASKPVLVASRGEDADGCGLHPVRTRASWAPLAALGLGAWMLQRRRARAALRGRP